MRRKNGFTLIELLAVIVILAIIALIATPIILNMINDAKKSAAKDSAYGYIEAIEYQNSMAQLDSKKYSLIATGDATTINSQVNAKGTKPTSGNVTITNGKVIAADLCINEYVVRYVGDKAKIVSDDCDELGLITEFIPETTGWQSERKITINYPNRNYKYYYKVTGKAKINDVLVEVGKELETTNPLIITLYENQTIETWMVKNGKKIGVANFLEEKIDDIEIIEPVAIATTGYPKLSVNGVVKTASLVISNSNKQEGTHAEYSIDNGQTWSMYNNEISLETNNISVKMVRNESKREGPVKKITISGSSGINGLGSNAYDNNLNTFEKPNGARLYVDEKMINKNVIFTIQNYGYISAYDESGTMINEKYISNFYKTATNYTILAGTKYLTFSGFNVYNTTVSK